jgi:uncharacterized membrane protein
MAEEENMEPANGGSDTYRRILLLFIIGFSIILAGIIILFAVQFYNGGSSTSLGAVIFIGPFPIVIGAGPEAKWIIPLAVVLAVLSIVMSLVTYRRMKKTDI